MKKKDIDISEFTTHSYVEKKKETVLDFDTVRQKAFGEIEENEYNVEVQKMDEWINRHYQESPVDDFER